MSSESIASRIIDRLPLSPEELVRQTIENMIPSKAKKEDSGSCKFALSHSSVKMDTFYVNFLRIYLLMMLVFIC